MLCNKHLPNAGHKITTVSLSSWIRKVRSPNRAQQGPLFSAPPGPGPPRERANGQGLESPGDSSLTCPGTWAQLGLSSCLPVASVCGFSQLVGYVGHRRVPGNESEVMWYCMTASESRRVTAATRCGSKPPHACPELREGTEHPFGWNECQIISNQSWTAVTVA